MKPNAKSAAGTPVCLFGLVGDVLRGCRGDGTCARCVMRCDFVDHAYEFDVELQYHGVQPPDTELCYGRAMLDIFRLARQYSRLMGAQPAAVLNAWERGRHGMPFYRYYNDEDFPRLDGGENVVSVDEWRKAAVSRFGKSPAAWRVRCPKCGNVQRVGTVCRFCGEDADAPTVGGYDHIVLANFSVIREFPLAEP